MTQIKLFKGLESSLQRLEDEVNSWLRESNAKIVNIISNIAAQTVDVIHSSKGDVSGSPPSDVLITIVYEK